MKLSIITINYNNLDGLRKTVDSIVAQSFSDFEWIVIDGASTDGSRELIEQYADRMAYRVSEPDTGIYNAMNKGIAQAHGDWLLFLNSGDWLYSKDTLQEVFNHEITTADVMYGDKMQWTPSQCHLHTFPDQLSLEYLVRYSICHQATFFRRELFSLEPYDEHYRIASDWAFDIRIMLQGKRFEHLPFPIVYYDNTGISAQGSERMKQERADVLERYIPYNLKYDFDKLNRLHHLYNGRLCSTLTSQCLRLLERLSNTRDLINAKK